MPTSDAIKYQLQRIDLDEMTKRLRVLEIGALPKVLHDDETLEDAVGGRYMNRAGLLVATNKRLLFIDKGVVRLRVEDFPYHAISSIQYETAAIYGKIIIWATGNQAEIEHVIGQRARQFAEGVRARITEIHTPVAQRDQPVPQTQRPAPEHQPARNNATEEMISQLERLASLKAQGILTEEEFQAQKQRILGP